MNLSSSLVHGEDIYYILTALLKHSIRSFFKAPWTCLISCRLQNSNIINRWVNKNFQSSAHLMSMSLDCGGTQDNVQSNTRSSLFLQLIYSTGCFCDIRARWKSPNILHKQARSVSPSRFITHECVCTECAERIKGITQRHQQLTWWLHNNFWQTAAACWARQWAM